MAFLQQNNFPAIVAFDGQRLVATHALVDVVDGENGSLTIYGRIARANPQWRTFGDQEVLLIFQGTHTYISPRWHNHYDFERLRNAFQWDRYVPS